MLPYIAAPWILWDTWTSPNTLKVTTSIWIPTLVVSDSGCILGLGLPHPPLGGARRGLDLLVVRQIYSDTQPECCFSELWLYSEFQFCMIFLAEHHHLFDWSAVRKWKWYSRSTRSKPINGTLRNFRKARNLGGPKKSFPNREPPQL